MPQSKIDNETHFDRAIEYSDLKAGMVLRHRSANGYFNTPPLFLVVNYDIELSLWKALRVDGIWEPLYPGLIHMYKEVDLTKQGRRSNPWMFALRGYDKKQRQKGLRP